MNVVIAGEQKHSAATAAAGRQSGASAVWLLLFLLAAWFPIVHHLRGEWSFNPQYSYGWSVPFLVLFLLWRRWLLRPEPGPCEKTLWPALVVVGSIVGTCLIRFLSEANPDWRLLSWGGALLGVAASMAVTYLLGGKAWLKHFAFPFLFFLCAVPWPVQFEQKIIQGLMGEVASLNVFALHLAGIPALQHGNVIEVGTGLIGIEEACSGVRSLQATLMISLFLGELYQFNIAGRCVLVTAGAFLAFVCNLFRTAFLVYLGSERGAAAIHAWHDPAGLTILLCCLFGLWFIGLFLRRVNRLRAPATSPCEPGPFSWPRSLTPLLVFGLVLVLLTEAGVQVWYGWHGAQQVARWDVKWPNEQQDFKSIAIPTEASALLQFNEGGGDTWEDNGGHSWVLYHFRWFPGRTAALFIKVHRPDVCLPASGMTLKKDNGIQFVSLKGMNLPMRSYRFDHNGRPLHVLYCYWDARSSYLNATTAAAEDWSPAARIRAALRGQREAGAQMLELAVWGYDDDALAQQALEEEVRKLISRR